ncbi:hypothetical protein [Paraburkholderia sp. A2RI-6]|uniref:hypothetical protein n=1 Tax=Paraburkholderia sp. A2RI-6 TaxID=3028371 RepID=UPI003BA39EF2
MKHYKCSRIHRLVPYKLGFMSNATQCMTTYPKRRNAYEYDALENPARVLAAALLAGGALMSASSAFAQYAPHHDGPRMVPVDARVSIGWHEDRYWDGHRYWERDAWMHHHPHDPALRAGMATVTRCVTTIIARPRRRATDLIDAEPDTRPASYSPPFNSTCELT